MANFYGSPIANLKSTGILFHLEDYMRSRCKNIKHLVTILALVVIHAALATIVSAAPICADLFVTKTATELLELPPATLSRPEELINTSTRLVLRKPRIIDRGPYVSIMTDTKVQEMENMRRDDKSAIETFTSLLEDGKRLRPLSYTATILERESRKIVGFIFLYRNEKNEWELGYDISPSDWGKGYATEAAALFLRSHSKIIGDSVVARIVESNLGSQKVALKLGFQQIGEEPSKNGPRNEKNKIYVLNLQDVSTGLPFYLQIPGELKTDLDGPTSQLTELKELFASLVQSNFFAGLTGFERAGYFKKFVTEKGIVLKNGFLDDPKVQETVYLYIEAMFRNFRGSTLRTLQTKSLKKALETHGIMAIKDDARETLSSQSKENVKRLLQNRDYKAISEMTAAERAVDELDFDFVHNTNALKSFSRSGLISSYRLEEIGFIGGLNMLAFNKDFLQSDDQVFFFVRPTKRGQKTDFTSSYGRGEIHLDNKYAAENGWISAFVMYGSDLMQAAKSLGLREYDELTPEFDKISEHNLQRQADFLFDHMGKAQQMKNQLYKLDFTVSDFKRMVKTQLLFSLKALKETNPDKYNGAINDLQNGNFGERNELLKHLVFIPLGIQGDFELKIPVAVPVEGISQ